MNIAQGPDFKEMRIEDARKQHLTADVIEIKVDGTCMTWNGSEIVSERGLNRNARFPHVVSCLQEIDWQVQGEMAIPGMGTRVFDVTASENWSKARLYIFDIKALNGKDLTGIPATEARKVIEEQMKKHRFQTHSLHIPRKFKDVEEGWDFITKNDGEGIVLKNDQGRNLKVKWYKEAKWEILGFEPGSAKGAFLLKCPNGATGKMSALSAAHIADYQKVLAAGNIPFAEFEYLYLTKKSGVPFQPRLRRIGTWADLQ